MTLEFKPWIKNLPEYVAGRTIEEIREKYNLAEVYKMASNENILGPCPQVKQYLQSNLDDINYYPDSEAKDIRNALSGKYGVLPENIIVGNGTDQIIEMICDSIIDRGDNIVTADPNFLIYEKATLKCGGEVIKVPLNEDDFRQNTSEIIKSVNSRTKIVFLTSPHNPTGTIIFEKELEEIIESIRKDVLIVMDEAYYEYMADDIRTDTVDYIKRFNNLMTLRTFSKIFGLAGLRIGYGIADEAIISCLNKIRLPFNISIVAQKAAVKALENESYALDVREKIIREKEKFYKIFDSEGIEYVFSHANFILVKTKEKSPEIIEELLKGGFIVRPGQNLGLPGYIRVTVSTEEINEMFLEKFLTIYKTLYQ